LPITFSQNAENIIWSKLTIAGSYTGRDVMRGYLHTFHSRSGEAIKSNKLNNKMAIKLILNMEENNYPFKPAAS